jgi:two-component system chemotaxis response regulator CheY
MLTWNARILIVDDSRMARRVVRTMLAELGFRNIVEADDGDQAFSLISNHTFALVISDWFMEPMSGLDLLAKLRRQEAFKDLPFILMTAARQLRFMEIARDAGATHYLAKPFTKMVLSEKLATLHDQRHIRSRFEGLTTGRRLSVHAHQ